jgi:transposase
MLTIERDADESGNGDGCDNRDQFPRLAAARDPVADFHEIIRRKAAGRLDSWLNAAQGSMLSSFARGIMKDIAAVRAAIALPWSNG